MLLQERRRVQHDLWGKMWQKALADGRQAGDKSKTGVAYPKPVVCF
jgi:hypothetical protein